MWGANKVSLHEPPNVGSLLVGWGPPNVGPQSGRSWWYHGEGFPLGRTKEVEVDGIYHKGAVLRTAKERLSAAKQ